jgi:hypothetical protein
VVEGEFPVTYALAQNYLNPFNAEITITYDLPEATNIRLIIYDLAGRKICILAHGDEQPGRYEVVWDGRDEGGRIVASGVYFYQLETVDRRFVETKRMLLHIGKHSAPVKEKSLAALHRCYKSRAQREFQGNQKAI